MTPSAILSSVEDIEPQRTRRTQRTPTIVVVLLCVLRVLCGSGRASSPVRSPYSEAQFAPEVRIADLTDPSDPFDPLSKHDELSRNRSRETARRSRSQNPIFTVASTLRGARM